jgi:hypothetical protein
MNPCIKLMAWWNQSIQMALLVSQQDERIDLGLKLHGDLVAPLDFVFRGLGLGAFFNWFVILVAKTRPSLEVLGGAQLEEAMELLQYNTKAMRNIANGAQSRVIGKSHRESILNRCASEQKLGRMLGNLLNILSDLRFRVFHPVSFVQDNVLKKAKAASNAVSTPKALYLLLHLGVSCDNHMWVFL